MSLDAAELIFLSKVRARALATTITAPETSNAPGKYPKIVTWHKNIII